ncbi:MAG: YCF48-related protein [Paludibacter sp.]
MKKVTIIFTTLLVFSISTSAQWTELASGINARVAYFLDKNNGYADANGVIMKTTDGGVNWSSQTSAIMSGSNAIYFSDINTGFIVNDGGKILKTIDAGKNWTQMYSTQYSYTLRSVNFVSSTVGYVVGANGIILKTTDGGTNWSLLTSGTSSQLRSVYFTDSNTGYAVGSGGTILKTTNGGTNWSMLTSGVTNELFSVNFTSATIGYAVGSASIILKTTDGGTSWTSQTGDTSFEYDCVYFTTANTGFITGGSSFGVGTIIKTTDGGTNWTTNWTPTQANTVYTSLCFPDANTGYAAGRGAMLKYSSNNSTVVATESWYAIMDNNANNHWSLIFEKKSDGTVTTKGSWVYNFQGIISSDSNASGTVTINGTNVGFTINGIASETTFNTTSNYAFSTTGIANKGKASGTYTINFANSNWPSTLQGTFTSDRISGSGVTAEISGIDNATNDHQIAVYPIPAKDQFSVKGFTGTALMTISDINGKLLIAKQITTNEKISSDKLANGVYFITIKTNDCINNKQLIIQK